MSRPLTPLPWPEDAQPMHLPEAAAKGALIVVGTPELSEFWLDRVVLATNYGKGWLIHSVQTGVKLQLGGVRELGTHTYLLSGNAPWPAIRAADAWASYVEQGRPTFADRAKVAEWLTDFAVQP